MRSIKANGRSAAGVAPPVLVAFGVVIVLFGSGWVAVRFSNRELAPFWGASIRFFAAGTLLMAVMLLRGIGLPRGRALGAALIYGALTFGLNFGLLYWALVQVPAGMTSVTFATLPLLTLALSAWAGYERIRTLSVAGGLLAIAGLALIFRDQLATPVAPERVAAVLVGATLAAAATVLVKGFPRAHPIAWNASAMLVGAVLLLATSVALGEPLVAPELLTTWLALVWLVVSTAVVFVLIVWVIQQWSPSAGSYSAVLAPVVTVVLATVLAGEAFGPSFFLGAAVVGAGVYVGAILGTRSD